MCGKQELDSDIIAAAAVFVDDQTQSTTVGEYLYTKMPDKIRLPCCPNHTSGFSS